MKSLSTLIVLILVLVGPSAVAEDAARQDADEAGIMFFEQHVRPLLVKHCLECHSAEGKQMGNLLLDNRESLLKGGDIGPAVVPGNAGDSLLIQAVRQVGDVSMPPEGKLSPEEIAILENWVGLGAPYPVGEASTRGGIASRLEQARDHWAFQPLNHGEPPQVRQTTWPRNDLDRYVLAKLEQVGLEPAPEADRATLIRRLTFDLLGLPPSPEEILAFEEDESPEADERLIDRLLASPHYGERWGRHWLDLARYADSSGFHNDLDRPWAWKYRDYVIRSFNEDKPYGQFVAEQLAGDEVSWASEETLIATGFCRNGPSNDDNMGKSEAAVRQYRADQLDDIISTTSTVFLGVTVGCARCHDHKTDPFTSRDYYSLLAVFNGTEKYGLVPGTEDMSGAKVKEEKKVQIQALVETKSQVPPTHIMRRGVATSLGEEVGPAVPAVLVKVPVSFPTPDIDAKSSLRRLTLAEWISSPENPLTWRVLANRIWQHHFGRGIVPTPSNFGFAGGTPSHPELLDYLASRLIAHGGRWKPVHKEILLSATYRQAVLASSQGIQQNPENLLLGRRSLRRMEAEVIRDSILAASGNLNLRIGGPGIKPRLPAELIPSSQRNKWPVLAEEGPEQWRRSVYIYSKRQLLMPLMELFDAPTTTDSCALRGESVVPTQALILMNDEFIETHAELLTQRVLREADGDVSRAIDRMFLLTLGRVPEPNRARQTLAFVQDREQQGSLPAALTDLAHVLINSSEFLYLP